MPAPDDHDYQCFFSRALQPEFFVSDRLYSALQRLAEPLVWAALPSDALNELLNLLFRG
jgi:hypothetical protein